MSSWPSKTSRRTFVVLCLAASGLALPACDSGQLPIRAPMAMRTLIVMTDGVPFDMMDSLHRTGHFSAFHDPSRIISTFPSISGIAFRDIWQAGVAPGYEEKYYDVSRNRIAGGVIDQFFRPDENSGFRQFVEVEASGLTTGTAYLTPVSMAHAELKSVRKQIIARAAYDTAVVAYILTTDAMAHRVHRSDLVAYMLQIEAMLTELRAANPKLRIVLLSDHGNEFVHTRRVPLEKAVRAAGFNDAKTVRSADDVVLMRFGLLGSAFLFSQPQSAARLAGAVRGVEGVDLAFYVDAARRIHVLSAHGEAIVESDSAGSWYRYSAIRGDPLQLEAALRRMQAVHLADSTGKALDTDWLNNTRDATYTDALRRITNGVRNGVRNNATVLLSLAPGYEFGNPVAGRFLDITSTHGSLRTASSLAYFMTTGNQAPQWIRSGDVLPYILGRF